MITLTPALLAAAMNITAARATKWVDAINGALVYASISTRLSTCNFLAQIGHESGSLVYVKELGNAAYFSKYDTGKLAAQLGNTPAADGDGALYCGRGLIQVTGHANYLTCSQALFGDSRLLQTPELLEQPEWAAKSAAWYWKSHNLNALADSDQFTAVTRAINGGVNGLDDRKARYNLALSVIKAA